MDIKHRMPSIEDMIKSQMRLKVTDDLGRGDIVSDTGMFDCHTYVLTLYRLLFSLATGVNLNNKSFLEAKTTAGNTSSPENYTLSSSYHGAKASSGVDDFGIIVGNSTDAEQNDDFKLTNQIMNGQGTNLLDHSSMAAATVTEDGGGTDIHRAVWDRDFNNNHASISVSVNEVGLACTHGSTIWHMLLREKLGSPVVVAVSQQLTVTITFDHTWPALT